MSKQQAQIHGAHRMVLSVRKRIHCGMGRFCLAFLASFILIRKVFCDGCTGRQKETSLNSRENTLALVALMTRAVRVKSKREAN